MDRKCSICSEPIQKLGFHFNGKPSCGSCRIFFHRNAEKFEELNCNSSNSCDINSITKRKKCTKCRLRRCFEIGMELKAQNLSTSISESSSSSFSSSSLLCKGTLNQSLRTVLEELDPINKMQISMNQDIESPKSKPKTLSLTQFEQSQIDFLNRLASDSFEEENNLELLEGKVEGIEFISKISSVYARPIVRFCKKFDFFRSLTQDEQLLLLKCFSRRAVPLRVAFQYNPATQSSIMLARDDSKNSILVCGNNHRKMVRIHNLLEQDATIRNLLLGCFLVDPLHENVYNFAPIIRLKYFHFTYLLHRYLESKHHKVALARHKYRDIIKHFHRLTHQMNQRVRQRCIRLGVQNLSELTAEVMNLQ